MELENNAKKKEAKKIKIGDVLYFSNKQSRNYGRPGKVINRDFNDHNPKITLGSIGIPFLDDRRKPVKIITSGSMALSFDDPETSKIRSKKNDILDDIERRIDTIKQDIIKLQTVIDEYKENYGGDKDV